MVSTSRLHRERELVAFLLFDKPGLIAAYRRALGLSPDASLSGVFDRDMIRAVLAAEYPADPPHRLAATPIRTDGQRMQRRTA